MLTRRGYSERTPQTEEVDVKRMLPVAELARDERFVHINIEDVVFDPRNATAMESRRQNRFTAQSYEAPDAANVWWLDVESGATGRVTDEGASVSVDWRQRDDGVPGPEPEPTPSEPASACDAAKIACVAKGQACLLKAHATARAWPT